MEVKLNRLNTLSYRIREAAKKSRFFSGPATMAPDPLSGRATKKRAFLAAFLRKSMNPKAGTQGEYLWYIYIYILL